MSRRARSVRRLHRQNQDDPAQLRGRPAFRRRIAFRWRGLEFARARLGAEPGTFRSTQEIVFGVGAEERILEDRNFPFFLELLTALRDSRHPYGPRQHPLFRLRPERWLESLVVADVSVIDERSLQIRQLAALFPGARILRRRPRHDRRPDHHP